MPLDHYVSQVHLRKFYSSDFGGRKMYAFRKRDLREFPCGSEDVCRIENGSTNEYLAEPRFIEEFLKDIEPNYNQSVCNLRSGGVGADDVFVISGFASYVMSCSPAAMRLHSEAMRHSIEVTAILEDRAGRIPRAPPELGGKTITELLDDGEVVACVDGKYPQAMGIGTILERVRHFGNSDWDILLNEHADSPFFTSDFPAAIEPTSDPAIVFRIIPLAPDLAIRIRPTLNEERRRADLSFPYFRYQRVRVSRSEARQVNESIVRCAEELVFSQHRRAWVEPFIRKNAIFGLETNTTRLPSEGGYLILSRLQIERREADGIGVQ